VAKSLQSFEIKYTVIVDSADYVYHYICGKSLYLISIQPSISKIFLSVKNRFNDLKTNLPNQSYPTISPSHEGIESLLGFTDAVNNISVHRELEVDAAKEILIKWLIALPLRFRQSMVTLISAHEVMSRLDVSNFLSVVNQCLVNTSMNPFLIKTLEDYGGTLRLIYRHDDELGRRVGDFQPIQISDGAEQATIIADTIISGTQIIKAIKHYACAEVVLDCNHFDYSSHESELLATKLKAIKTLNICTVLYVQSGVDRIQAQCRKILKNDIVVKIISGRDVSVNANFGTTEKIGNDDKLKIKELLTDRDSMESLYACLNYNAPKKKSMFFTDKTIEERNLIARYQSLPKKCFKFLHLGTRINQSINPLIIIPEKDALEKG